MALSKYWIEETTIYSKPVRIERELTKLIYRDNDGFEAFVIREDEETYRIKGNGVNCNIWKKGTKSKIHKVSADYQLRKFNF